MRTAIQRTRNSLLLALLLSTLVNLIAQDDRRIAITISEEGVGPINAATPFDIGAIQKLLPSFRVTSGVASTEGIEFPTIRVMDGETELFVIAPDENRRTIGSVVITSARVPHAGKGKVGALFSEIYGDSILSECFMGTEQESGNVICRLSPTSHIRFVFKGASDRLDEGMPSRAALKKWRVDVMFWRP